MAETAGKPKYDGNGGRVDVKIDASKAAPTKVMEANGVKITVPASFNSPPVAR